MANETLPRNPDFAIEGVGRIMRMDGPRDVMRNVVANRDAVLDVHDRLTIVEQVLMRMMQPQQPPPVGETGVAEPEPEVEVEDDDFTYDATNEQPPQVSVEVGAEEDDDLAAPPPPPTTGRSKRKKTATKKKVTRKRAAS